MNPPFQSESLFAPSRAATTTVEPAYPRATYAWYVVGVLTLAYTFSFIDRQIIAFMIKDIKRDFGLNHNLLGMGLGPLVTGWLTDHLSPGSQGQLLHLALLIALVAGSLGAVLTFARGLKPYRWTCEVLTVRLSIADEAKSS